MKDEDLLIAGWLDGDLDPGEEKRLKVWLEENPAHLDQLVEASIRDQQLRDAVQLSERARSTGKIRPFAERRNRFIPSLAAAALVVLGVGATLWFSSTRDKLVEVEIVSADNARLQNRVEELVSGSKLSLGPVFLESGRLVLDLASGVRLEMIAPLKARLIDDMHLRLEAGRLNADVGERGKGFTVCTEAGDIIDLGTEFGIEVDSDGESRVAVFSGQVEVHPREKGISKRKEKITLNEGQAARFSALAGLRRWDRVAIAAKAAGISDSQYSGIVRSVRDNLGDKELHPFYGVVSEGMREGALAHTDKPNPAWRALEGEAFPEWLIGADQIRTYHQFRNRLRYKLELDLAEPAIVYVFQDIREEAPAWLTRDFSDTGTRIRVGPWNPAVADEPGVVMKEDSPYLTAGIWKREVPAGIVKLGPPRDEDSEGPVAMYGLAVKPQQTER